MSDIRWTWLPLDYVLEFLSWDVLWEFPLAEGVGSPEERMRTYVGIPDTDPVDDDEVPSTLPPKRRRTTTSAPKRRRHVP